MGQRFQGRWTSLLIISPPLCSLNTSQEGQPSCQPQGYGTAAPHPKTGVAPKALLGAMCNSGEVPNGQFKTTLSQGVHLSKHPSRPSSSAE